MTTKSKVFIAFVLIFITGFISGVLLSGVFKTDSMTSEVTRESQEWRGDRERSMRHFRQRIIDDINLTAQQEPPFFDALHDYKETIKKEVQQNREEEHKAFKRYYDDLYAELSEILSDEQLEKVDSKMNPDNVKRNWEGRRYQRGQRDRSE